MTIFNERSKHRRWFGCAIAIKSDKNAKIDNLTGQKAVFLSSYKLHTQRRLVWAKFRYAESTPQCYPR